MAQEYVVDAVIGRDEWSGNYGPMVTYTLSLQGEAEHVELNQKPTTPPPAHGEKLNLDIHEQNGRRKAKRINPAYSNTGGGSGGVGGDPQRERRIIRQHSQEMAIRLFASSGGSFLANDEEQRRAVLTVITKLTDHFDNDVAAAAGDSE